MDGKLGGRCGLSVVHLIGSVAYYADREVPRPTPWSHCWYLVEINNIRG
jgi:hypothetical protein